MAVWHDLSFSFEEILASSKMNDLDENFDSLAEGAAGAPRIQLEALHADFSGLIWAYGGTTEKTGFKLCNGQAISRTTFSNLFNVIGTTYGAGDGSTTFNVPDLRDRIPVGDNTMGSSDAGRIGNYSTSIGDTGGTDQHTTTNAEMPSHNHGGSGNTSTNGDHTHSVLTDYAGGSNARSILDGNDPDNNTDPQYTSGNSGDNWLSTAGDHSHSFTVSSDGSDNAHDNVQPFIVVYYVIKT